MLMDDGRSSHWDHLCRGGPTVWGRSMCGRMALAVALTTGGARAPPSRLVYTAVLGFATVARGMVAWGA